MVWARINHSWEVTMWWSQPADKQGEPMFQAARTACVNAQRRERAWRTRGTERCQVWLGPRSSESGRGWDGGTRQGLGHGESCGHCLEWNLYFECSAELSASIKQRKDYVSHGEFRELSHVYDSVHSASEGVWLGNGHSSFIISMSSMVFQIFYFLRKFFFLLCIRCIRDIQRSEPIMMSFQ